MPANPTPWAVLFPWDSRLYRLPTTSARSAWWNVKPGVNIHENSAALHSMQHFELTTITTAISAFHNHHYHLCIITISLWLTNQRWCYSIRCCACATYTVEPVSMGTQKHEVGEAGFSCISRQCAVCTLFFDRHCHRCILRVTSTAKITSEGRWQRTSKF